MLKYIIKRILLLIPVFLGVTFVIFAIVRMNPADPVYAILGINITEEQYAAKAAELGLDQPFLIQYLLYIKDMLLKEAIEDRRAEDARATKVFGSSGEAPQEV